jgi:hypothetical protein
MGMVRCRLGVWLELIGEGIGTAFGSLNFMGTI